jgi:hypothetical protein
MRCVRATFLRWHDPDQVHRVSDAYTSASQSADSPSSKLMRYSIEQEMYNELVFSNICLLAKVYLIKNLL